MEPLSPTKRVLRATYSKLLSVVNRNPNKKQLAIDDHCDFLSATVKEIAAPCADVPEGELYKKVSFVLQVASELINPTGKTRWQ
ncbi:Src42A, partial [Symbiodinium sp. CCMP2456]